jgi:hypothetical protein
VRNTGAFPGQGVPRTCALGCSGDVVGPDAPSELSNEATRLRASLQLVIEASEYLIEHAADYTYPGAIAILRNIANAGLRTAAKDGHEIALSDIERFVVPTSARIKALELEVETAHETGPMLDI